MIVVGAEMGVAVVDGKMAGIAVLRVVEKTRSSRERACDTFALDSGCQRQQAHRFYFREGMTIPSFHFSKKPDPA